MLEENEQLIIWAGKKNVYVNVTSDVCRRWAAYNLSGEKKCLCKCHIKNL
jgi:hypothetical protein